MKKFTLFFVSFWVTASAYAECDNYLQFQQSDPRKAMLYKKDCEIQDRYAKVQTFFSEIGINVAEVAEYRLLRFVDRTSYERARENEKSPAQIYDPAPMTWEVWDTGTRTIFGNDNLSFVLFKNDGNDYLNFSNFNTVLLKNAKGDISRNHLSGKNEPDAVPGIYRKSGAGQVGWTSYNPLDKDKVTASQHSIYMAQSNWEATMGSSFSTFVKHYKGHTPEQATFVVNMSVNTIDADKSFVAFASSDMVPAQISWLNSFVKANLERYRVGKPVMPPIEFSALVQKWLVTIHPFSDGNGRTSRAAQDMILANFKMPYVPGGDLQNDVLESFDKYVDQTYAAIESMVTKLEVCAEEYRQKKEKPSYGCRTVKSFESVQ